MPISNSTGATAGRSCPACCHETPIHAAPSAEALAVKDGKILAVGPMADVLNKGSRSRRMEGCKAGIAGLGLLAALFLASSCAPRSETGRHAAG